jgi:hypothetical protein
VWKWHQSYDAALWDHQFERDAHTGTLDKRDDEALADHDAHRTRGISSTSHLPTSDCPMTAFGRTSANAGTDLGPPEDHCAVAYHLRTAGGVFKGIPDKYTTNECSHQIRLEIY